MMIAWCYDAWPLEILAKGCDIFVKQLNNNVGLVLQISTACGGAKKKSWEKPQRQIRISASRTSLRHIARFFYDI